MNKFFVKENQIVDNQISILGEDVNHIKNVLRLNYGDKIKVCDTDNTINYICEVNKISKEEVECTIIEKVENEAEGNVELHIFQGLPKADKMELIIQKGTELGISKFIPVKFNRSIVKLTGKDEIKKIERWQKIAEVAAKQCGRDIVPKVENIQSIKNICNLFQNYDIVLIAYELEKDNYIKNELKKIENKENYKIAVVIGPEGGIEPEEIELMKQQLNSRVVRLEN